MHLLILLLAILLGIVGVTRLISGDLLWGVIFIVLAFIVGPGGYSIFR